MKLPSIIRTPKHNRFGYEPRYYDPVKEEIDEKLRRAREQKEIRGTATASNISEAFRKRQKKGSSSSAIQLILAAAMLGTFVGWLFYGNQIFYVYILLSPLYFYFRLKNKGGKS